MIDFKNWTLCLEMSAKDEAVLKVAARLAQKFKPERINLLHIMETSDLPDEVLNEFPDLHHPELANIQSNLEGFGTHYFGADVNVNVAVIEGDIVTELLRYNIDNKVDLIFIGCEKVNSGALVKKVARKSSGSVIVVPEGASLDVEHIAISTDFSDHSTMAMKSGLQLAENLNINKISALHVYKDASKYLNESIETAYDVNEVISKRAQINKKLKVYSEHKLADHVKAVNNGLDINQHTIAVPSIRRKSQPLQEWIVNNNVDMVVMGAKGESIAKAVLLGSVTEEVYTELHDQIVLLVKKKGENKKFLKALLGR